MTFASSAISSEKVHVGLLGDSVFDSSRYLWRQDDMAARLAKATGRKATLLAVSGSRLGDLTRQILRCPTDLTHMVISAGGNDLLDIGRRLRTGRTSSLSELGQVTNALREFGVGYATLCQAAKQLRVPTAVCTVYEPPVGGPLFRRIGSAVLDMINITIRREASRFGIDVIDLRTLSLEPTDFADAIHPSAQGANKIAAVLGRWLLDSVNGVSNPVRAYE